MINNQALFQPLLEQSVLLLLNPQLPLVSSPVPEPHCQQATFRSFQINKTI
jgi:hypothetical protein